MPTLNLGRVRFNWRGDYDPNASYLEYDVVKDDGQSYVAIQDVADTDPGPNEAGGEVFWEGVLLRGADYNYARDQAVQAASDAQDSAGVASGHADAAGNSATEAAGSMEMAWRWANEDEDVEVVPGLFSAYHWAQKAAQSGSPDEMLVTADETSDTRALKEWTAAVLATQQTANSYAQAIGENQEAISNLDTRFINVTSTAFLKQDGSLPAWSADGATLETATPLAFSLGDDVVTVAAETSVTLPTLSSGTDYLIYAKASGELEAVGADEPEIVNARLLGGFHAAASDASIVASSLWDLNWRPASNPRAMVLSLDGRVWADIYLMDVEYALHGYSRLGQQIADDNDRPIIPDAYGGNGSNVYGSMSWWVAVDLATAAGKRLPFYSEFTAFAYGVVERQAVGTDPGTTQHQAGHRSGCGVEQVTGVMYQWGADIAATDGSSWRNIAEGRGDVYASNITAPRFGASWLNGSNAGSRVSRWSGAVDVSVFSIGARAVCAHVNLQAER